MTELFSLAGKVALVTGGAQGLGRMIAQGLIDAGASVFITSRKADMCDATAAQLGSNCHALPGDAGSPEGIADLGRQFRQANAGRPLHVLVNNAGRTWGAPIDEFPDKAWPGVMAVNVQAPFRMMQEFLPELEAGGTSDDPARIVNIGSIAGSATTDLNAYSYAASKAALHHLTRQMARDLAPRHINANVVVPGYFATSMTAHLREDPRTDPSGHVPLRRLGQPEDIAGTIVYAASRASAYMTGAQITIDGGLTGCA